VVTKKQRPKIPFTCPPEITKVIASGWNANPKDRPNTKQIIARIFLDERMRFLLSFLFDHCSEIDAYLLSHKTGKQPTKV
jgi:hypothetical protein